jgi:serine/threonine protein kinase/tetratricopeptide (TPR) repeat protein
MKRRVISHYEFVRKIGAGGSGVVFLATDTLLQRPVVLKLLKRGALTLDQVRTTQLREARLASAIDHPNVCAIYDVGEAPAEDGNGAEAYIVMQYIPGQALDKLIAKLSASGPPNLQLVLSAGIQIADGLAAAHSLGIFHRDLKPANVMLTEGGLVKILDFGLARRLKMDDTDFDPSGMAGRRPVPAADATYTARGGTIAYMAPEQFVTGQSSVQSDIFAVGLILYELSTGRHPFHRPDSPEFQSIRAIQFADPTPPREINRAIPSELQSVILRCLEKQPSSRFASAADLREALKMIMMALQLDTVGPPGESVTLLPSQRPPAVETPEEEKRTTGILSMLAERFRESSVPSARTQNTIVVLPFINFGRAATSTTPAVQEPSPLYGYALADAIAARLARMPSLIVRPSSSLATVPTHQLDPLAIGRKLLVHYVLAGNFLRSEQGFDLNWQLLDVNGQSVRAGGSINVASFDLVAVQTEICNEVFSTLHGIGGLQGENHVVQTPSLSQSNSEDYLQARAVLSSFMSRTGSREDLDRARELFESVTGQDENFAPGWSGLGITHLQYASHGLGGQMHVLEARRAFDKSLALDPGAVESNLYRVYMLLSRGEKESARHGIESLLRSAGNDWNVHLVAGQTLRIDGMYDEALDQFNRALRLNPSNAALIYNNRARVFQYQNQLELAADEIEKGLTLEPKQPLLRISLGYQQMRTGDLARAIETLEKVTQEATSLRIVYPTIALCYVQLGEREKAASFIVDETLSAAEADSEMAYRLATYFALEGDESEALHWLRRAIYLGNENYPWFSINPAWRKLGGHSDFERILEDLKKSYRKNQKNWRRLLSQLPRDSA